MTSDPGWAQTPPGLETFFRGKTAGLFGAVAAVASSLVVVLGLVSIPAANAAPYRTHAVDGGATKSSLVSPHTPADSTAPLNSVVSEVYTGDNAPIVTESTPDLPTLSLNGADQNVLISTWNSSFLVLNSASTPIVAGQTYGDPASQGVTQADVSIKVGAYQCGSVYSDVTIDQLVVVGGVVGDPGAPVRLFLTSLETANSSARSPTTPPRALRARGTTSTGQQGNSLGSATTSS